MLNYNILLELSLFQTAGVGFLALFVGYLLGSVFRSRRALQLDDPSAWHLARQMASELRRIDAYDDVGRRSPAPVDDPHSTPVARQAPIRVRLFIDLPNFEMNWKANNRGRMRETAISWQALPNVLLDELPKIIGVAREELRFVGAELYESYIPYQLLAMHGEAHKADNAYFYRRRRFLETEVALFPGYAVHIFDRTLKFEDGAPSRNSDGDLQSNEKGVDSGLISHLFLHASGDTYDIALLLGEDSDYVPAVRALQTHFNKRVIHVRYKRRPHGISGSVWGDIVIDRAMMRKLRKPTKWFGWSKQPENSLEPQPSINPAAQRAPADQTEQHDQAVTETGDIETTKSLNVGQSYWATVRKVSRHGLRLSVENGDDLVRVMPCFQTIQPFLSGEKIEDVFWPEQRIEIKVMGQNQKGNPWISVLSVQQSPDPQ